MPDESGVDTATGGEDARPHEDGQIGVFVPVHATDGSVLGFVYGLFEVPRLVDDCLAEERLREEFRWRLTEQDGALVNEHGEREPKTVWPYTSTREVPVVGRAWNLELAPSPPYIDSVQSIADDIAFVAGLVITLLLVFLLRWTLLFTTPASRDLREARPCTARWSPT